MIDDLERFVYEQDAVYHEVLTELRQGEKRSHWMWFIFPQLRGLGESWMAHRFGIEEAAEAASYLDHPILGPRLLECTKLVQGIEGRSASQIFGEIDAMKLRSSMTLFSETASDPSQFTAVIDKYFEGRPDPLTLSLLRSPG